MKIINEINHVHLGKIFCVSDRKGGPLCWMKEENIKIFNSKLELIPIYFNFYCFNKLFKCTERRKNKAEEVKKIDFSSI